MRITEILFKSLSAVLSFQLTWLPVAIATEHAPAKREPASVVDEAKESIFNTIRDAKAKYPDLTVLDSNKTEIPIEGLATAKLGADFFIKMPKETSFTYEAQPQVDSNGGVKIALTALDSDFKKTSQGGVVLHFDPNKTATQNAYEMRITLKAFAAKLDLANKEKSSQSRSVAVSVNEGFAFLFLGIAACIAWSFAFQILNARYGVAGGTIFLFLTIVGVGVSALLSSHNESIFRQNRSQA